MSEENANPVEPIAEIDLKDNGGLHQFFSTQEIYEWVELEISNWSFIRDPGNKPMMDPGSSVPLAELENGLRTMKEMERHRINEGQGQIGATAAVVHKFKEWTNMTFFTQGRERPRQIHSASRIGSFIQELKISNPKQATWSWWLYCRPQEIHIKDGTICPELFNAAFRGAAFELGFDSSAAELRALEAIRSSWKKIFADDHKSLTLKINQTDEVKADLQVGISELREQMQSARKELEELRSQHVKEMDAIKKKYSDDLAMRSAVDYWDGRASHHQQLAVKWGKLSWQVALVSAVFLIVLQLTFGGIPSAVQKLVEGSEADTAKAASLLTQAMFASSVRFVTFTLLAVWPIRIVIRNYLSNLHLEVDARERSLVVKTYLALLNDPDVVSSVGVKEQILAPALERLFRPSSDGIVKDDAMPWQSFIDAIKPKSSSST